ncbi:IS110 family transposase [Bacteroidota bacterium]
MVRQIYGIDLSKEKFDVNFLDEQGKIQESVVKNDYKSICDFLSKLTTSVTLCIEYTGVYGDLLVFLANSFSIEICATPGYEIKHSLGLQKGKSDPMDAARIREYGERFTDKLKPSKVADEVMSELRELHNLRHILVKQRALLKTQCKGKCKLPYESIKAHELAEFTLQVLDSQIIEVESEIQHIINLHQEYQENSQLIQSIRGIGPVTASELIIKTHNFIKIDTARKAASFAGICPYPNSSGNMIKKSKISSMGDKSLKTLLFLCARCAITYNKDMKQYYNRKKEEGKHTFIALNNVANKLLRTIYAIIESRQMYDPNYICMDPRLENKIVA